MSVTICPVCCGIAQLHTNGLIGLHQNSIGKDCMMSGKLAPPWDERSTRQAVRNRSGGICEFCLRARATEMHHRKSRGVRGPWSPANILHLCNDHHRRCTVNRSWGRALGLVVKQTEDPGKIPVLREDLTSFQPDDMVTRAGKRGD
jgi:hypothetical protein